MTAAHTAWLTLLLVLFTTGAVLAEEGIVVRTDVCRKGTIVIKTRDGGYVAAYQETMAEEDHSPWSNDENPPCSFFAGEHVSGDLSGAGPVTLTDVRGRECDYVIEGSGDTLQDAEQILGCE
jgi:hypothetical protein